MRASLIALPLPGGSSDKYGNRYEDRWAARCAFDVLRETALSIRSEPPGAEDAGVDLWVSYPGHREYHQVKRQLTGEGRWTLGALETAGVLTTFYEKLRDTDARCVFVSTHAPYILEELADRASKAESYDEYERDLLAADAWRTNFGDLCRRWGDVDPEWAWEALRRIRTETISDAALAASNSLAAELLFAGEPEQTVPTAIAVLRDRVNERLTADELWQALAERDVEPTLWTNADRSAISLKEANIRYSQSREAALIGGQLIEREEAVKLAELIDGHPVVVLDGPAGMGKSDVLLGFLNALRERGTPHLAMRLDRQTPTASPEALGHEIGLPASPPAVLAAVAQGKPSVLVIDQLDVVSTSSGRNPQFLECVEALLRLVSTQPSMHVVMACRTFDLANDARLRALVHGQEERPVVTVTPLGHTLVRQRVGALGFDVDALTKLQIELLAVPLHLALLTEIATSSTARLLDFSTRRDLYDAFWKHKRLDIETHLGRASKLFDVADTLVDFMSSQQALRAPCELVDAWEADADAMASAHVLMRDGRSYAFFHETFFDYLFARRFIARGESLRQLLARDQLLFRRAQVRQILAHKRDSQIPGYADDLAYLIDDPGVRFHLKDLVFAWLTDVSTPTSEEWALLRPHLEGGDEALRERAWRLLASPGWFAYADQLGLVDQWLEADGEVGARIRWAIGQVTSAFPERAAQLISSVSAGSEEGQREGVEMLSRVNLATDRAIFDVFLKLLDDDRGRGGLAESEFWFLASELPSTHPTWGCELLGHYVANRLALAIATGVRNPFSADTGPVPQHIYPDDFMSQCAEAEPLAFIEQVFGLVLTVIEQTADEPRSDYLRHDELWAFRHYGGLPADFDDQLLHGLERAFAGAAHEQPDRFERFVAEYAQTDLESVVHLCFRGFAANPKRFADPAIDFLLADLRRFQVSHSSANCWGTRELIKAISIHASASQLQRLSEAILAFYTRWERSADGHSEHGLAQFCLLGGIDESVRSPIVNKRFAELQRKFQTDDLDPPLGVQGGTVHSPIPPDSAEKMTDAQWRSALARYDDDRGRDPRDFLKGGAHQLSSVLEKRTEAEPARFARIALTLPDDTNALYFDAILRGVRASESTIPLELTTELCLRCHALPERPTGMWIGGPITKHSEEALPEGLIEMLNWYATAARGSETTSTPAGSESGQELEQHGLNSTHGMAATCIAQLVHDRKDNLDRLRPAIGSLVANPAMAVRTMAARIVVAALRFHHDEALDLFDSLIDGSDDSLLASRAVQDFLRYCAPIDFQRLKPPLERMLASTVSDVQTAGAAWVTLSALDNEEAHALAESCLAGNEQVRVGAARVYAANLTSARYRERCENALRTLFQDDCKDVRHAASAAVTKLSGDALGEFEALAQEFLDSRAADDDDQIILMLTGTTARVPALALNACETIFGRLGPDARDIRTRAARLAGQLSEILVRAYADSDHTPILRERALDLIDQSLRLDIYGAHQAIQEHDRG